MPVTDRLKAPGSVHIRSFHYATGALTQDYYSGTTVNRIIGDYKSLSGSQDGRFIPGQLRLNPVVIVKGNGRVTTGILSYSVLGTSTAPPTIVEGPWIAPFGAITYGAWDSNLESSSSMRGRAKLQSNAVFEGGVFIAELRETLDMLYDPLGGVVKLFKKNGLNLTSLLSATASTWMELRYGVMPLLRDIEEIRSLFEQKLAQSTGLGRERATVKIEKAPVTLVGGSGAYGFNFNVQTTDRIVVKSTSVLYYRRVGQVSEISDLLRMYGLHRDQLPNVVWNAISRSFVVDWFLDVGSWLSAISPNCNVSFLGGCTSQTYQLRRTMEATAITYSGLKKPATVSPSTFTWESDRLERKVGIPAPVLPVLNPKALGIAKTLDSLAMIWQQIAKR